MREPKPATLGELSELVGGRLRGGSGDAEILGVSSVEEAGPQEITWLADPKLAKLMAASKAGAIIVTEAIADTPMPAVVVGDPEEAIARVLERFAPPIERPAAGVHLSALLGEGAEVDRTAAIGAWVRIGAGARVGAGSIIHAGVHIGSDCRIGRDCEIQANAYVGDRCIVKDRVVVKPGAVIGSDG